MAEEFKYNDMMKMQSEAVQRVREMQRRAQNVVQRANAQRTGRAQEKSKNEEESPKQTVPPIRQPTKSTALPLDYITHKSAPSYAQSSVPPPREEKEECRSDTSRSEADTSPMQSTNLDRLLVIALILLLSQEEADELLLMALGYLIM